MSSVGIRELQRVIAAVSVVSPSLNWSYNSGYMLDQLRSKLREHQFEFSKHAVDQSILRHITVEELQEAITVGEIIEDYPEDKYGPSCLIFGFTRAGRALHVQCSYPSRDLLKIITLYEPDPSHWVDFRVRRT